MAIFKRLNGWNLMVIAVVVGCIVTAIEASVNSERVRENCLQWRPAPVGMYGGFDLALTLVIICFLLFLVGLIWGLVSLFVRIEKRRSR